MACIRRLAAVVVGATLLAHAMAFAAEPADGASPVDAQVVAGFVEQLDRGSAAERAAAERALVELAVQSAAQGEAVLALLPTASEDMSQETTTRLARLRAEVQTRLASRALQQSRVTLDVKDALLDEVLAEIEKQTGNRVQDYRGEQNGGSEEVVEKRLTLSVADVPFWEALDRLLDETAMATYPYDVDGALGLVERPEGALRRHGRGANYAGPFRVEATNVRARRGLRAPDDSGVELELEIAWEPRLHPVGLSHRAADLKAATDDDVAVPAVGEGELFNVETPADYMAAEVTLPLQLPGRKTTNLKTLAGHISALTPGRVAEVRFDNLEAAADVQQDAGGVMVTLNRVAKNQALWELQMRIAVGTLDNNADASRGWVFQNETYLEDSAGERIEHAGYETTMQNERELGFAYFFELPEGKSIGDYTWVYRTPAAIVNLAVDYELKDIPLP